MNSTAALVDTLKSEDQDFEFYPTTPQMAEAVAAKLHDLFEYSSISLLDIGAGDGRTMTRINEGITRRAELHNHGRGGIDHMYAIEKSQILRNLLPDDAFVVGTDFHEQTLIDKQVDAVFCNPPYSEWAAWSERIILEANAKHLFIVIPRRWADGEKINRALARRKCKAVTLMSADFEDAERQARAKADVLWIDLTGANLDEECVRNRWNKEGPAVDPFDLWFDEHFPVNEKPEDNDRDEDGRPKEPPSPTERVKDQLVKGRNHIDALVELYNEDLRRLVENHQTVGRLDADLLRELGVKKDSLREGIRAKIAGLKKLYWQELFDRLKAITERLITARRDEMSRRLTTHVNVDFTVGNVYAVVMWALKNANHYIDEQLVTVYRDITAEENVKAYKSNVHWTKDTWRNCRFGEKAKVDRYTLDYRIVIQCWGAITSSSYGRGYGTGLDERAHHKIGDILTVARNLGFATESTTWERHWIAGRPVTFHYTTPEGTHEILAEVKAFKNGNIHCKFAIPFMRAFNVEAGRLLGWIKNPHEAAAEMGIDVEEAESAFRSNLQITPAALLGEGSRATA